MIGKRYHQDATYWGSPVNDGTGGFSYATPVALKVRWEEKQEQYSDEFGETKVSQAVVYITADVEVGGYLLLGTSVDANPANVDGAYEIKQYAKIPDLRNAQYERRAFL